MIGAIVSWLCDVYVGIILIYVLMSWIPNMRGWVLDIYRVLGSVCDPYLNLFRRIIPPIGMIDISPVVAIIVLEVVARVIAILL